VITKANVYCRFVDSELGAAAGFKLIIRFGWSLVAGLSHANWFK
jgi:hypothetical protein